MPTPSDAEAVPGDHSRRLHPLSWIFALIQQLRAFAIPLVILVVTGRSGSNGEWIGLVGVVVMTGVAVVRYFTYRYDTGAEGIVVRSGVLQRTRRDIPYDRIHTVNLHQTVLHRLLGVTDVRLESAGSQAPEAVMRVLSLADARALEELIQKRGGARRQGAPGAAEVEAAPLVVLGTGEIVRLGLISNRGMVVVAAVLGLASQVLTETDVFDFEWEESMPAPLATFVQTISGTAAAQLDNIAALVVNVALLIVLALILVRALSVVLALLQFHGFRLWEVDRQLRVQRGLLTRVRLQLPRRRIQAWRIDETLIHRWFGRQTLRVDSASGAGDERGVRDLAPVATPDAVLALIERIAPQAHWPPVDWRPIDPRAWRRLALRPALIVSAAAAAGAWFYDVRVLGVLILVPWIVLRARRAARAERYAVDDSIVAVRQGWLNRRWAFTEIRKIQSLRLTASPFDRRLGMATVWIDTAGVSGADGVLHVRFLPEQEAREVYERLVEMMVPVP